LQVYALRRPVRCVTLISAILNMLQLVISLKRLILPQQHQSFTFWKCERAKISHCLIKHRTIKTYGGLQI
jgi:hypothetical protein